MTDLIEAPTTNGRHPPASPDEGRSADVQTGPLPIAVSPQQMAIGAAVIAGIVLVVFRGLRRRRR